VIVTPALAWPYLAKHTNCHASPQKVCHQAKTIFERPISVALVAAQGAVHRRARTPELFRQFHFAGQKGPGAPRAIGYAVQDFCHDVPEGGLLVL
jgi:hypothetical protein